MNEDDTFNRLRRTPIDQMIEIIIDARVYRDQVDVTHILRAHGWTSEEYEKKRLIHFGRSSDE